MSSRNVSGCGGRPDLSGHITVVCTSLLFIAASFFLFYLLSGPPTFLQQVRMSGKNTLKKKPFTHTTKEREREKKKRETMD